MTPQHSNRANLIEGTLRCLERLPPERITARAIAEESGANLASIAYHFGSKDKLVTEAAITGLDRWLEEVADGLGDVAEDQAGEDASGLVLAQFYGLLFQTLLDPGLAIEGDRMRRAQARLRTILPVA